MYKCPFCGREFKYKNGNHLFWCDPSNKERQEKCRKKHADRKHTEEEKKKISISHVGEKNYNYGKHPSEKTREKMSESRKGAKNHRYGKHLSNETKEKISKSRMNTHASEETKKKLSKLRKKEKNPNWKGGCCSKRNILYNLQEWKKAWRIVYKRDNGICQCCGEPTIISPNKFNKLFPNVHHIVPFECEILRLVLSNLVLMCKGCHDWIHSKKNIKKKFILKPTQENITIMIKKKNTGTLLEFLYCYNN